MSGTAGRKAKAPKTATKRAAAGSPDLRTRTRPVELIVLSAVFGVFTGLVVGFATREWILAAEFFGVVFIVSLVVLAMLVLGRTPESERPDVDDEKPSGH